MRANSWIRAFDALIEACWLLAIVAVPIFFDTMTQRIFEPDKIVLFRNIVLVMVIAVLARAIVAAPGAMARAAAARGARSLATPDGDGDSSAGGDRAGSTERPWWRDQIARYPLIVPVLIFAAVYTAATINSVLPGISFWGSYDRAQGLYTWLNYIAFFFILAYSIRSWVQVERIISAIVFASIPVAAYGIIQHLQWDPVQWGADTSIRVASTLGNAIFLGAYLLMCMPFAGYRLWRAVERYRAAKVESTAAQQSKSGRGRRVEKGVIEINGLPPIVPVLGYAITLMLSFAALYFCGSRGPYYGFITALVVIGFLLTAKLSNPYPAISSLVLAVVLYEVSNVEASLAPLLALLIFVVTVVLACAVLAYPHLIKAARPLIGVAALMLAIFVFPQAVSVLNTSVTTASADTTHLTDLNINGTSEVRTLIWRGSIPLIEHRPILGWGPETMIYVYSPYYLSQLGHLEHSNAAPDRNHDEWLDFLVFSGVIGLAAWLVLLAAFAVVGLKVLQRARALQAIVVVIAVGAVVVGHLAEATVGIDIVSTLMLLWTMFALVAAFYARPELLGTVQTAATAGTAPAVAAGARVLVGAGARGGAEKGRGRGPQSNGQRRPNGRGQRGQATRPVAMTPSFEHLSGGQQGVLLGFIVLTLVALIGGSLLFANNVQVVRADAAYKQAQGFDNAASACLIYVSNPSASGCPLTGQGSYQQILTVVGQQFLPTALSYYQQATSEQPNQDYYDDPGLGKTYLDYARYFLDLSNLPQAVTQFTLAQSALMTALHLNPYNSDHPMNLARTYSGWAQYDASKWVLADKYYAKAMSLSRHNGRWFDEWGLADMGTPAAPGVGITRTVPGEADQPTLTPAQRTTVYRQALAAFQQASNVDDLLGDARVYRGLAQDYLGMYKQAAASYREALQIQQFEDPRNITATVLEKMLIDLHQTGNYKAMVTPFASGPAIGLAPITVAISPTVALNFTPAFAVTLPGIERTLRHKGLLK